MSPFVLQAPFTRDSPISLHPGVLGTLLIAITFYLAVASSKISSASKAVKAQLPPSVAIEAALDTERLSSSKVVRALRFLLRHLNNLFTLRHEIVPDVPSIERQLIKSHETFDQHPMGAAMLRRIFGCRFPTDMGRAEYVEMHDAFMKVIARDFINESAVIATLNRGDIGGKISDLITFSDTSSAQTPWERLGNVKISNSVAEVDDLESMLKALSSCIAMPLLYGHDYLQRTPNVLEDWDCFASNAVSLLALGIPSWVPIPSFQRGIAARGRLLESLAGVYRRIRQHHEGEPVDFGADMSDVSETVLDRYKVFAKHRLPVETIAQIELSLLWAQNKNTQQLLVWYVFYVYSVPGLLEALRREISASGAISMSGDSSSRITSVDIPSLSKDCLLLRSCFLESFRLAEESVMFRKLTQPVKMDVDVKNDSQVELPAGSWVTISNCRTKHVPSLYPIPLEFVPDRFIVEEEDGRRAVTYGPLRPWGIGPGMCKGRTFAEKQLLAVVACIATLWDMESVDLNSDRSWRHPGFKTGATVMAPGGKMRVRIKQRSTTKY